MLLEQIATELVFEIFEGHCYYYEVPYQKTLPIMKLKPNIYDLEYV